MPFLLEWIRTLIEQVSLWVHDLIAQTGYWGVVGLMALESCNIPVPSEVILTFAGYLVQQGRLDFHLAALAGAVGCVVGSVPSYWLGYYGGRPFLYRHGKWLLVTPHDLHVSERWVAQYGTMTFFICRMLPVVRTFISLPAGVLRASFWPFLIYTFIGSWIWSYGLVWVGVKFGENKAAFTHIWHKFDAAIIGICFLLGVIYVYKHVQHFRAARQQPHPLAEPAVAATPEAPPG